MTGRLVPVDLTTFYASGEETVMGMVIDTPIGCRIAAGEFQVEGLLARYILTEYQAASTYDESDTLLWLIPSKHRAQS